MFEMNASATMILTIFAIAASGYLLGRVKICGISLGTAAIFLSGLVFGHYGAEVPAVIQSIGLTLFIASVGLSAGGTFVERLKQNGKQYAALCLVIALLGALVCP